MEYLAEPVNAMQNEEPDVSANEYRNFDDVLHQALQENRLRVTPEEIERIAYGWELSGKSIGLYPLPAVLSLNLFVHSTSSGTATEKGFMDWFCFIDPES